MSSARKYNRQTLIHSMEIKHKKLNHEWGHILEKEHKKFTNFSFTYSDINFYISDRAGGFTVTILRITSAKEDSPG